MFDSETDEMLAGEADETNSAAQISYWTIRRRARAYVDEQCQLMAVEHSSSSTSISDQENSNNILPIQLHADQTNTSDNEIEFNTDEQDERNLPYGNNDDFEPFDLESFEDLCNQAVLSSDDDSDSDEELDPCKGLQSQLKDWALDFQVPHVAIASLLQTLQNHHPSLPKDPRTLLGTVKHINANSICNGEYYHFGIESGIKQQLRARAEPYEGTELEIQINIDGLPLFKSDSGQFWPILGMVNNIAVKEPCIYGLYFGKSKPKPLDEYLFEFIEEMKRLEADGITYADRHYNVKLCCVVCDAPARSFVKNTKGHSGYKGCDKCTVDGTYDYDGHKVIFPEIDAAVRTDDQFAAMSDEDHHHGPSPFSQLSIGMVSGFPLDYMHLVCLGVTRRLLLLWLKGPLPQRIGTASKAALSERLVRLREFIPREFARKPRKLDEMDRWKATEFRLFLLYCGPVVLQGILMESNYKNFLVLHVAIRLLASPRLCMQNCDYAYDLLVCFVKGVEDLYGSLHLVYNIHGVIHLPADVKVHGALDNFSSFPFENFLQTLKKLVRKPKFPLQQVVRRISELDGKRMNRSVKIVKEGLRRTHCLGPVPNGYGQFIQYKELQTKHFLVTSTNGNNCVSINGHVVLVCNILTRHNDIFVVYKEFQYVKEYYEYPLDSTLVGTCVVGRPKDQLHVAAASNMTRKYVLLPLKDHEHVAFPLL